MNVLIVGGGGREHALAWKAAQSPDVSRVLVTPGNGGTELEPGIENVGVGAEDIDGLVNLARRENIDLTIVGPEAPLVAGITDAFSEAGLRCFGPSAAASRLEGSKAWMKDFLCRHSIPTASYDHFTDVEAAIDYIRQRNRPLVVKADGLAAGKGVILARDTEEAIAAAESMLAGNRFGDAGHRVVIEDLLEGEEVSFIVMVDGEHILPLATSQDHKARDEGDRGPNTGGMGAYSPAMVVSDEMHTRIVTEVIETTVRGLTEDGCPYTGFLYAGLMITEEGPRVLEYNCRFGDPEAQPILMRLESDLVELCNAGLDGRLNESEAHWKARTALGVVMAAGGYPDGYRKGDVISGIPDETAELKVFHAGTKLSDGEILTAGGRVLCVVALGDGVADAQSKAYSACENIHWDNAYYRRDIGHRAVARERVEA